MHYLDFLLLRLGELLPRGHALAGSASGRGGRASAPPHREHRDRAPRPPQGLQAARAHPRPRDDSDRKFMGLLRPRGRRGSSATAPQPRHPRPHPREGHTRRRPQSREQQHAHQTPPGNARRGEESQDEFPAAHTHEWAALQPPTATGKSYENCIANFTL